MTADPLSRSKLDADLLRLLQVDYEPEERVPVIVYTKDPESLELTTLRLLERRGRIRCSLRRLNAVSAWVSIRSLPEIADWEWVSALEMAQPVDVKH